MFYGSKVLSIEAPLNDLETESEGGFSDKGKSFGSSLLSRSLS